MEHFIKDEELDRELRETMPYIDDDGFTRRVMQQLPAPRAAESRLRGVILITAAVLATVLTYFLSGGGRFVDTFVIQMSRLPMLWLLIITLVAGLTISTLGLIAAVLKTRESPLIAR